MKNLEEKESSLLIIVIVGVLVTTFIYLIVTSIPPSKCEEYPKYRYDDGTVPIKCYKEMK